MFRLRRERLIFIKQGIDTLLTGKEHRGAVLRI
jgi:hypothetical protein